MNRVKVSVVNRLTLNLAESGIVVEYFTYILFYVQHDAYRISVLPFSVEFFFEF